MSCTRRRPPAWHRPAQADFLGLDVILAQIWKALKWVAEKAAIIAIAVARAVAAAARYTWRGLQFLGKEIAKGADWLRDRLADLAKWWKEKAAPWIVRSLDKIGAFFKRLFGWLQKWVHRLEHILGWLYKHVLRPLLVFLELTRLGLRLLATLGVKWAAKLEEWIQRLEAKLFDLFQTVAGILNSIADLLDALFDPTGAFKRKYFTWSLIRWWQDVEVLSLLAGIDRNPWPEALQLAEGPDPTDVRAKGNQLEHDLERPPVWVIEKGRLLSDLLG